MFMRGLIVGARQVACWPGWRDVPPNTLAGGLLQLGMAAEAAIQLWGWVCKEAFASYLGPGSGLELGSSLTQA